MSRRARLPIPFTVPTVTKEQLADVHRQLSRIVVQRGRYWPTELAEGVSQ